MLSSAFSQVCLVHELFEIIWISCQMEKLHFIWKSRFLVSQKRSWGMSPAFGAWRPCWLSPPGQCSLAASMHYFLLPRLLPLIVGSAWPLMTQVFWVLNETANWWLPLSSCHIGLFQRDFPEHFRNIHKFFWAQVDGHSDADKDLCRYVHLRALICLAYSTFSSPKARRKLELLFVVLMKCWGNCSLKGLFWRSLQQHVH